MWPWEEERSKEGLKGGAAGLVYNAAFVIPAWKACLDMEPPPLAGFEMQESVSHTFRSGSKSTADINLEPRVPAISTSMHQMSILNSSQPCFTATDFSGWFHEAYTTLIFSTE